MSNGRLLEIIPWGIALSALLVLVVGWIGDVRWARHPIPDAVSMKLSTSVSFVLAGVMSGLNSKKTTVAHFTVGICLMTVAGLMLSELVAIFANVTNPLDTLLMQERPEDAIESTLPGQPSIGTGAAFLTHALAVIFTTAHKFRASAVCYGAVGLAGLVGLVGGYVLHIPELRFYWESHSTAMAPHTAAFFACLGLYGVIEMRRLYYEQKEVRACAPRYV